MSGYMLISLYALSYHILMTTLQVQTIIIGRGEGALLSPFFAIINFITSQRTNLLLYI